MDMSDIPKSSIENNFISFIQLAYDISMLS